LRTFNPGEPVFHQGQVCKEFFGVIEGRFAKVQLPEAPGSGDISGLLARARLIEIFDKPHQVFGEIEALLERPQPYSVFALAPAEAISIPVSEDSLLASMVRTPQCGFYACLSLARQLRDSLAHFSRVSREDEAIDKLLYTSARAYKALLQEIEQVAGPGKSLDILEVGRTHPAWVTAEQILEAGTPTRSSNSVYSATIRPPAKRDQAVKFNQGSLICKRGCLGDRMFILLEGGVEVVLDVNTRVQIARPGSVIGEIAVLLNLAAKTPNITRTADVICASPVSAIVLGLEDVEEFLAKNPDVLTNLMLALSERTKETFMLGDGLARRIHHKLMTQLRHFLEGHHRIASLLQQRNNNRAFDRPFTFAAQQTRQIYTAFAQSLEVTGPINTFFTAQ
jgi:CRP-like cAMP-binding protein